MIQTTKNTAINSATIGTFALLLSVCIIIALYIAQVILIPLALAILLTFLFSHPVSILERWIGRIASIFLTVVIIFIAIGATGYIMALQVTDLAAKLPNYKSNIASKFDSLHIPQGGVFKKISDAFENLKNEAAGQPAESAVQFVEEKIDIAGTAKSIFGIFFTILGTAGFVLLLVFFMLLHREDLRGRLILLIGQGRISSTTMAIDDASNRIIHYLYMQTVVNFIFGTCVAIGLSLIGIPNAVLWGGLGFILRYIPYLGVWLAAFIPVLLSFAISAGWGTPILTIFFFLSLEFTLVNFAEPLLYGSSTGISPMALIVAAVFWTWLWGPMGLVLSTPLTVCLVVMGHHVGRLKFLTVLLSDETPLAPYEELYYRILAGDQNEALAFNEAYLKTHTLTELYDQVFIPVISLSEMDLRSGLIDQEQALILRQSLSEMIEDLSEEPKRTKHLYERILCIPAKADRDELAGKMLTQLLKQQSIDCEIIPVNPNADSLIDYAEKFNPDIVCISATPPTTTIHARYLSAKLLIKMPKLKIIIGIWQPRDVPLDVLQKLHGAGANVVATTLDQAVSVIK
jgi:predicted PurR-regulated permease PerM